MGVSSSQAAGEGPGDNQALNVTSYIAELESVKELFDDRTSEESQELQEMGEQRHSVPLEIKEEQRDEEELKGNEKNDENVSTNNNNETADADFRDDDVNDEKYDDNDENDADNFSLEASHFSRMSKRQSFKTHIPRAEHAKRKQVRKQHQRVYDTSVRRNKILKAQRQKKRGCQRAQESKHATNEPRGTLEVQIDEANNDNHSTYPFCTACGKDGTSLSEHCVCHNVCRSCCKKQKIPFHEFDTRGSQFDEDCFVWNGNGDSSSDEDMLNTFCTCCNTLHLIQNSCNLCRNCTSARNAELIRLCASCLRWDSSVPNQINGMCERCVCKSIQRRHQKEDKGAEAMFWTSDDLGLPGWCPDVRLENSHARRMYKLAAAKARASKKTNRQQSHGKRGKKKKRRVADDTTFNPHWNIARPRQSKHALSLDLFQELGDEYLSDSEIQNHDDDESH